MIRTLTKILGRKKPAVDRPVIAPVDPSTVSPDERKMIREWLASPITRRVMSLVEGSKPATRTITTSNPELNSQLSVRRLAQLEGWESYRNTLLGLAYAPVEVEPVDETFPDNE